MASLVDWLKTHLFKRTVKDGELADVPMSDEEISDMLRQGAEIQHIALDQCISLIANAVGKCEFRTYRDGKEVFGDEYYRWNIKPNENQGSSEFIHKWIRQLMLKGEALIVPVERTERVTKTIRGKSQTVHEKHEHLYIADSFDVDGYVMEDAVFKNITFKGRGDAPDIEMHREYQQSEVLYFKMPASNVNRWLNAFMMNYQKLIDYAMDAFLKSRGSHGILKIKGLNAGSDERREQLLKMYSDSFKSFYNKESSAMPLDDAVEYKELSQKTYSNEQTRDIRALIDDVRDITAQAFGIPIALLSGRVEGTQDAIDNFMTFCIDPICIMMQEEITGKVFGREDFKRGCKIKIDTSCIKHTDVLSVGDNAYKAISSGVFTINQIRRKLGEDPSDDPEADKYHFISNNQPNSIQALLSEPAGESPESEGGKG